jgi:hypothetical protein
MTKFAEMIVSDTRIMRRKTSRILLRVGASARMTVGLEDVSEKPIRGCRLEEAQASWVFHRRVKQRRSKSLL